MKCLGLLLVTIVLSNCQNIPRRYFKDCFPANLDIYFLAEVSSALGSSNVRHVRNYVRDMTGRLRISPSRTRVSITIFGSKVTNLGTLNDLRLPLRVRSATRGIVPQTGRRLNPLVAMNYMADNLFTRAHGLRNDRKPVCVVILSTRFTRDPTAVAARLQEHCKVVAIGAGDAAATSNQVHRIASPPRRRQTILSRRHQDLARRVDTTLRLVCKTSIVPPPSTAFGIGPTSFSVRWEVQPSIQRYMAALRALGGSGRVIQERLNIPPHQLQVTFRRLDEATTYIVNIWARGTDGTESSMSRVIVTTSLPIPEIEVDQSTITTSSVHISWGKTTDLVSNYYITVMEVGNPASTRGHPVAGTNHVITELSAGTRYRVTVSTLSDGIRSQESDPAFIITVPDPPVLQAARVQHIAIYYVWNPVKGGIRYNLVFRDLETNEQQRFTNYSETTLAIRDLTPSKRYELRGRTIGARGKISSLSRRLVVVTAPSNPDIVRIVETTSDSVTFAWGAQPAALGYSVSVTSGRDFRYKINTNVTNTRFTADGLQPGVFYTVTVLSIGLNGFVDANVVFPLVAQAVPDPPNNVEVTDVSASTIHIAWEPVYGVRRYIVFSRPLDGLEPTGNVSQTFNRSISSATVENLKPGTLYDFYVISEGIQGQESRPTESIRDSTYAAAPARPKATFVNGSFIALDIEPAEVPSPPHDVRVMRAGTTSLKLRWLEARGALSYILYVHSNDFDEEFTEEYTQAFRSNDTEYDVTGLRPGTRYRCHVQSVGHAQRKSSLSLPLLRQTIPGIPQNVRRAGVTVSTVTLQWDPTKGAASYHVIAGSLNKKQTYGYNTTRGARLTASDLAPGTWYNFTVYARDPRRQRNDMGSAAINVQTVPLAPPNVKARRPMVDSYKIVWDDIWGAAAYRVRAFTTDNDVMTKEKVVRANGTTEALVDELDSGTRYRFFISSIGFQEQVSHETDRISDVTLPATPEQVSLVRVTTRNLAVSWNQVKGAEAFAVEVLQSVPFNATTWELMTDTNNIVVRRLIPGGWYNISVFSIGIKDRRNNKGSVPLREQTVPLAPITIDFTEITSTNISMEWNSVIGAGAYTVTVRDLENRRTIVSETETVENIAVVEDLAPGTRYSFQVTSIGEDKTRKSVKSSPVREETNPDTPDQATISEVKATTLRLDWNSVKGARQYVVRIMGPGLSEPREIFVAENNALIHSLNSGTLHHFSVFSIGIHRRRNPRGSEISSAFTAPAPPTGIETSDITTREVNLKWNVVHGAVSYTVSVSQYGRAFRGESPTILASDGTRLLVGDLDPGTEYVFDIRANGEEDRISEAHPEFREATLPDVPDAPVVGEVSTNSITISWSDAPGALSYQVFVEEEHGEVSEHSAEEFNFVLRQLDAGIRYSFRLRSIGPRGHLSNSFSPIVTQQTVTDPPLQFTAISAQVDAIALSWRAAVGASSYSLVVRSEDGDEKTMTFDVTSAMISQLGSGLRHTFILRSIGDDDVESTESSRTVETTLPATPSSITVDDVTPESVRLSWPQVRGAVSYRVEVDSSTHDVASPTITSQPGITIRGLNAGMYYNVKVFSIGTRSRANEDGSDVISVQTDPSPPVFQVNSVTTTSIPISWNDIIGASGYRFRIKATDGSGRIMDLQTEDTNFLFTSLLPGVEYEISGWSIGEQENRESFSYVLVDSTLPDAPGIPQRGVVTSTSIEISWERKQGAVAYLITVNDDPLPVRTDNNRMTRSGLEPGSFYRFQIHSVGAKDRRNPEGSPILRVQTAPAPANNFAVIEETTNSITLSWDDVVGRSVFEITATTSADPDFIALVTSDTPSVTVTGLSPGVAYFFQLQPIGQQRQRTSDESVTFGTTYPATPQSLTEVSTTTSSVNIQWAAGQGALSYEVVIESSLLDSLMTFTTEETLREITGLVPGGVYTLRVFSIGTGDRKNPQGSGEIVIQTIPLPPSELLTTGFTTTSVDLTWEDVFGRDSFNINVLSSGSSGVPEVVQRKTTSERQISFTGLDPGTAYEFQIQTVGTQNQRISATVSTTQSTLPATPELPTIVSTTPTTVSLEWSLVAGALRYSMTVHRLDVQTEDMIIDVTTLPVLVEGLTPGASYQFTVYSIGVDDVRNEQGSPSVTQQTITLPPSGLQVGDVTTTSLPLSWDNVYGAASYTVIIHEIGSSAPALVETASMSTTSYMVTSLTQGTEYRVRVRSVGVDGSESLDSLEAVTATLPAPVESISIVSVTTDAIEINWPEAQGSTSYVVVVSDLDDVTESTINSAEPSIVAGDLQPGRFYRFNVISVGALSFTNNNSDVHATAQTVPLPPSFVEISEVTTRSFLVSWDEAYGVESYIVIVTSTAGDDETRSLHSSATSFTVNDLLFGTSYDVAILSVGHESQRSAESDVVSETTRPDVPTELRSIDVTTTSAELQWNEVKGALSYQIHYGIRGSLAANDVIETSSTTLTVEGLEPGMRYQFVAFSVGIRNRRNDEESEPLYLQTIPLPPESLEISDVTTTSMIVTWDSSVGAVTYRLSYLVDGDDEAKVIMTSSIRYQVTDLLMGTRYTFAVQSVVDTEQVSDISDDVSDTTVPATPTEVEITSIETTRISLSWEPQKGAVSYRISVRNLANNETDFETSSSPNAVIIELLSGTFYQFVVFSVGTSLRINPQGSDPVSRQTVPSAPSNILNSDSNSTSLSVTWQAVNGAVAYALELSSSDSSAFVPDSVVTSYTSAVFHNLSSGTVYSFQVVAIGAEGQRSEPGLAASRTVLPGKPDIPTVTELTIDHIHLEWPPVKGAVGYQVIVTSDDEEDSQNIEVVTPSLEITSLSHGTLYQFVVFSISVDGKINPEGSDPLLKQTVTLPPADVQVENITTTSLSVAWEVAVGASSYKVIVHEINRETTTLVESTSVRMTSYVVTSLRPGRQYTVKVRTVGEEEVESGDSIEILTATLPDAVSSISVTGRGTDTIEVRWPQAEGAQRYMVIVKNIDDNTESSLIANEPSITATALRPGRFYRFNVISIGPLSFENTDDDVSVSSQTVPLPTDFVETGEVTTGSFHLTWDPSFGAASYIVKVTSSTIGDDEERNIPTLMTSMTVDGLLSGTSYDIIITSVGGEAQRSADSDVITEITLPETTSALRQVDVTSTSAQLQWNAVKGAVYYQVYYRERGSSDDYDVSETTNSALLLDGLEAGLWYEVRVFSVGARERRNNQGSEALSFQTVPLPPTAIRISDVTTTSLLVTWDAATGATSYRLSYKAADDDDDEFIQNLSSESTEQNVVGLAAGTRYRFTLQSIGGESQASNASEPVFDTTVPATPTEVAVVIVRTTSVELAWQPQKGAVSYRISVRNLANNETVFETSSSPSAVITELLSGTFYQFVVFSVGTSLRINPRGSDPVSRQTVPSPPSNIVTSDADVSSLLVTWQAVIGAASYVVTVTSPDTEAVIPSSVMTSDTSALFNDLSSGTVYLFSVVAVGGEGFPSEPGEAVTRTVLPGIPGQPQAVEVTRTSVEIEWSPVKGAVGYQVIVTNEGEGEEERLDTPNPNVEVVSLIPGDRYRFVVFSVSENGKTNPEGSEPFLKQTITDAPSGISILDVRVTSFTVSWQPVSGAQRYVVDVTSDDDGAILPSSIATSDLSALVQRISPGTAYDVTVAAINFEGERSEQSRSIRTSTLPPTPEPPRVTDVRTNQVFLSWLSVKGATSYNLVLTNTEAGETENVTTELTTAEFSSLEPGTFYETTVFAVGTNGVNNAGSESINFQTVPLPPSNVEVVIRDGTVTSLLVTWQAATGAGHYEVQVTSPDDDVAIPSLMTTSDTFLLVENLDYGTIYQVTITAVGMQGQRSQPSDIAQETIAPDVVKDTRVVAATSTSVSLEWTSVKGALSYVTFVKNTDTNETSQVNSTEPSSLIASLQPGTVYEFTIHPVGINGVTEGGSELIRKQTVPVAPTNVAFLTDSVTNTSISLSWRPVKGALSYDVIYGEVGTLSEATLSSETTTMKVSELFPGTAYIFRLKAVGEEGRRSEETEGFLSATKPDAVEVINIVEVTSTSVSLQWRRHSGAKRYHVVVINMDDDVISRFDNANEFAIATALRPGTLYRFSVISIGALNVTNVNYDVTARARTIPLPPRVFEATDVSVESVGLLWSESRGAASYIITVTWRVLGVTHRREVSSNSTSVVVDELLPGTDHQFTVTTRSLDGVDSEPSEAIEETTRPDVATNLLVRDVTTTSITLEWEPVKGARRYVVYYRERHSSDDHVMVETDRTFARIDGLAEGFWFEFVVFSVGSRGRRNDEGSDILHLQTIPLAPMSLTVNDVTTTSLVVSWNDVTGAQSYRVRIVNTEGGTTDEVGTSEENNFLVQGLQPGTSYEFYVTSVGHQNQQSAESEPVTDSTVPSVPEGLRALSVTTNTASLAWNEAKGATGYVVTVESVHQSASAVFRPTTNFITLRNLAPGGWYDVKVTSVGAKERANPLETDELQVQTVPLPPEIITASLVETDLIRLEWNEVLGARSYVIRVTSDNIDDIITTSESNSLTTTNLRPGTMYGFYVTSIGETGQRSIESVVVTETTVPGTPHNVRVVSQTTTTGNITWDSERGAVRYVVSVRSNNTEQGFILRRRRNFISIQDLLPGGWYAVEVSSIGVGDRTNPNPSETVRFQTVPTPAEALNVTSVATNRINLQWVAVQGARSYRVKYYDENNESRQVTTSRMAIAIRSLSPGKVYTFTVTSLAEQAGIVSAESERITELTRIDGPENLEFYDETTNSVRLSWQAVEGASSYHVLLATSQGERFVEAETNRFIVQNLNPGFVYNFRVASIDAKGRQSLSTSNQVEVVTVTLPPSNLRVTSLRPGSITIIWDPPQGAIQYHVDVMQGDDLIRNRTTDRNRVFIGGLEPGSLYVVSISAINRNGRRSENAVMSQRTVPVAPSSIVVILIQPTYLNLTWEPVNGADSYDVVAQRLDRPRLAAQTKIITSNIGSVEDLVPGTRYRITVFAISEDGFRSVANTSIVQRTRLEAPKNLIADSKNETSIQLDWDDVKDAQYYSVYVFSVDGDVKKVIRNIEVERKLDRLTSSQADVTNLQAKINYTFEVTATSAEGLESDRSISVTSTTYALSPELPQSLTTLVTVSQVGTTNFTARWQSIENAAGYVIVVRGGTGQRQIPVRGFRNTDVTISGLEPDTEYAVTLKAVGVIGDETEESSPPATTRTRPLPPARPTGVTVTKIRASYVEVEWEPSRRAISYIVRVLDEATGLRQQLRNIPVTYANITGLTVLNNYVIQVAAVGEYERSSRSIPKRFQARHPVPVMPRNRRLVTIRNITTTSMEVTIEPIEHASRYVVILRSRFPLRRLRNVMASTPLPIGRLAQNTAYDVTYRAIGRGGDLSEESNVVTTRTLRLIPGQPVDFQVINITSDQVTVLWQPARFAVGYRVSSQNTRTGVTKVYENVTSPFHIPGLVFRETYNISAASVGMFFDSEYVTPITIDIPYPEAEPVVGITADLTTFDGFRLRWYPTPFAVSYTIMVALGSRVVQEIRGIRTISHRVEDLKPDTNYNVTVLAVSHDGPAARGEWIITTTGRRRSVTGQVVIPSQNANQDILQSIIDSLVTQLLEIPRSALESINSQERTPEERDDELSFEQSIQEKIQQMKIAVENILERRITPPPQVLVKDSISLSADYTVTTAIENLRSLAGELKGLVRSNDATEATADSIATRLTQVLTVLVTSSLTTLSRDISREEVNELLFPYVHHQINDLLISGRIPVVIQVGPTFPREQRLTILIDNTTITSSRFVATWGGYQNTHRYQVVVERFSPDVGSRLVFDGIQPGRSIIMSNLEPSTFYDLTIRPVDSNDEAIPRVVGRARIRTSDPTDENFDVDVTSLGYNHVTLSWERFPAGVRTLLFTIVRRGAVRPHQQFSINRAHSRVTFTSLIPGTDYQIIATSAQSSTAIFSTRITTLSGTPPPTVTEPPISNTLVSPSGLQLVSFTSQTVTVEWFPVRIRGRSSALLRYNVRVFVEGSTTLRRFIRFQSNTRTTVTGLDPRVYDITVSTYNIFTRRESSESPKLRVDLSGSSP